MAIEGSFRSLACGVMRASTARLSLAKPVLPCCITESIASTTGAASCDWCFWLSDVWKRQTLFCKGVAKLCLVWAALRGHSQTICKTIQRLYSAKQLEFSFDRTFSFLVWLLKQISLFAFVWRGGIDRLLGLLFSWHGSGCCTTIRFRTQCKATLWQFWIQYRSELISVFSSSHSTNTASQKLESTLQPASRIFSQQQP